MNAWISNWGIVLVYNTLIPKVRVNVSNSSSKRTHKTNQIKLIKLMPNFGANTFDQIETGYNFKYFNPQSIYW